MPATWPQTNFSSWMPPCRAGKSPALARLTLSACRKARKLQPRSRSRSCSCRPPGSVARLDVGRLDDRPPFLDLGLVVGVEGVGRLLITRRDVLDRSCSCRPPGSVARLDVGRLDDRPPFLDLGLVVGVEGVGRLLITRRDV